MITFTIITCTYNAAGVLRRTLDSVLAQTYPHVEHIIVDGVSRDNTFEIAAEYKLLSDDKVHGHCVIISSEPDNGLYDAMNKGIGFATGDYLVFLNAGDALSSPDTLYTIASCVKEGKPLPGVLYGDTDIVDNNGIFLRHRRLSPPQELSWKSFKYGMLVCHQAFYARTDIARKTPYDLSLRFSADVDWCIRVMRESERQNLRLCNVHVVIVNYLDGGMTVTNHKASLRERFRVMRNHYGLLTTMIMHVWFMVRGIFSHS